MKKKKKKLTSTKTTKKRFYNPSLVWSRHEHAEPLLHSTSGSSISMNIRIGRSRYLKMNDVIYSGDIETTSCNIRRKENRVWRMHESNSSKKTIKWIHWDLDFLIIILLHTCQDSSAVDAVLTESAVGRHWYWAARQVAWVFGCRQSKIRRLAICQDIEVRSNTDTRPDE